MKTVILGLALLASGTAHATTYGIEAQKAALRCTGATMSEAANGDFSRWVLPDWIPGKHLRAGQYLDADCRAR